VHGSFSMMVNLYAVCEYNRLIKGVQLPIFHKKDISG
jgi:hypothetical protein